MSDVNLNEMLDSKGKDFERPPLLPVGTYSAIIQNREYGQSSQKKTPYVRFFFTSLTPGDDVEQEDLAGIDLGKRTMRDDFYLTPDAMFRLREFAESIGVESEQTVREMIEDCVGKSVNIYVGQEASQRDPNSMFNTVRGYASE